MGHSVLQKLLVTSVVGLAPPLALHGADDGPQKGDRQADKKGRGAQGFG